MSEFKTILSAVRSSLDDYNRHKGSFRKTFRTVSPVMKLLTEWHDDASKLNLDAGSDHLLIGPKLTKLLSIILAHAIRPPKTLSDWMVILLLPKVFTNQEIQSYFESSKLPDEIKVKLKAQLHLQVQFVNSKPASNHLPQTRKKPFAFFEDMPSEIRYSIFQELPTKSLMQMKNSSKRDHDLAIVVLFERRGSEACWYQQRLMESWLSSQEGMNFFKKRALLNYKKKIWIQHFFKGAISDPSGSIIHKLLCLLMMSSFSDKNSEEAKQFNAASANLITALTGKLNDSASYVRQAAIQALSTLASKLSDAQKPENFFENISNDTSQSIGYAVARYIFITLDIFARPKPSSSLTCNI